MGDALNLDGLELTVVDTRGLLVGRQLVSQLSVSYAHHLPGEPAGSWFTSISFGIVIVQIGLYIRSQASDP